jgi:hypothetical protein
MEVSFHGLQVVGYRHLFCSALSSLASSEFFFFLFLSLLPRPVSCGEASPVEAIGGKLTGEISSAMVGASSSH